jgi:hypothetical protein
MFVPHIVLQIYTSRKLGLSLQEGEKLRVSENSTEDRILG